MRKAKGPIITLVSFMDGTFGISQREGMGEESEGETDVGS